MGRKNKSIQELARKNPGNLLGSGLRMMGETGKPGTRGGQWTSVRVPAPATQYRTTVLEVSRGQNLKAAVRPELRMLAAALDFLASGKVSEVGVFCCKDSIQERTIARCGSVQRIPADLATVSSVRETELATREARRGRKWTRNLPHYRDWTRTFGWHGGRRGSPGPQSRPPTPRIEDHSETNQNTEENDTRAPGTPGAGRCLSINGHPYTTGRPTSSKETAKRPRATSKSPPPKGRQNDSRGRAPSGGRRAEVKSGRSEFQKLGSEIFKGDAQAEQDCKQKAAATRPHAWKCVLPKTSSQPCANYKNHHTN